MDRFDTDLLLDQCQDGTEVKRGTDDGGNTKYRQVKHCVGVESRVRYR